MCDTVGVEASVFQVDKKCKCELCGDVCAFVSGGMSLLSCLYVYTNYRGGSRLPASTHETHIGALIISDFYS